MYICHMLLSLSRAEVFSLASEERVFFDRLDSDDRYVLVDEGVRKLIVSYHMTLM